MAWELPLFMLPGFTAENDLSGKQYHFVKPGTVAGTVDVCSAATDKAIGVMQNAPVQGEAVEIMAIGISKVSSDAALAVADLIGPSADGQADAKVPGTDITEYVHGQVLEASGAAGGIATAMINCATPHRAA